jgi:hypothetical protein
MIKIEQIDKEKENHYFIIYSVNKKLMTCNGTAKEVLASLSEVIKEINDK